MDPEIYIDWDTWLQRLSYFSPLLFFLFKRFRVAAGKVWAQVSGANSATKADMADLKITLQNAITDQFRIAFDKIRNIQDGFDSVRFEVSMLQAMFRNAANRDEIAGTVYCDDEGGITWASEVITKWMDADQLQLSGMRWLNYVHPEDRKAVREEFASARDDHREFRMEFRMSAHGAPPKSYLMTLSPFPENSPAAQWSGYLRPVA